MYSLASMFMVKIAVPPGVKPAGETDFCMRTSSIVTVCCSVTTDGLVGAVPVKTPVAETLLVMDCSGIPSRVGSPLLLSRFEPCSSEAALGSGPSQVVVFSDRGMPATYLISFTSPAARSPTFQVTAVYTPERFPSPGTFWGLSTVSTLTGSGHGVGSTGGAPSGPEPGNSSVTTCELSSLPQPRNSNCAGRKSVSVTLSVATRLLLRIVSVYVERWSWTPRSNSPSGLLVFFFSTTNGARFVSAVSLLETTSGSATGVPLLLNFGTLRSLIDPATVAVFLSTGTIVVGTGVLSFASNFRVNDEAACRSVTLFHTSRV